MNPFPLFRRLLTPSFRDRPDFLDSFSTAGCGGIDPCTPGICERLSTPSDESYSCIMLRRSITLKTAVDSTLAIWLYDTPHKVSILRRPLQRRSKALTRMRSWTRLPVIAGGCY